jgi:hypothetical protein
MGDGGIVPEHAEEYAWLVERAMGRFAVQWPEEIDVERLCEQTAAVLGQAMVGDDGSGEGAASEATAVEARLTDLLAGSEWYRQAVVGRARPLCDAWKGALLAGREPTDHLLKSWLCLGDVELTERFLEMAIVFAVEPAALLPFDADLHITLSEAVVDLPPEQQLVTGLYFQEALTLSEIADVMSIEPVEAQSLLGRSATTLVGETALANWPGRRLVA